LLHIYLKSLIFKMHKKILFLFILFCTFTVHAQFENTNRGATKKGNLSLLAKKTKTKKPTSIKVDASNGFKTAYKKRKKSKKEIEKSLNNKGIITQAQLNEERSLQAFKKINGRYQFPKIDQDLGSFRTESKTVRIICRDYQYPDGDRVTIYVNDIPVVVNIVLQQNYQSFTIPLTIGINKIVIKALNQGTSGPNTAAFKVYNDAGMLISSNEWNLATGAKATLLIAKDK